MLRLFVFCSARDTSNIFEPADSGLVVGDVLQAHCEKHSALNNLSGNRVLCNVTASGAIFLLPFYTVRSNKTWWRPEPPYNAQRIFHFLKQRCGKKPSQTFSTENLETLNAAATCWPKLLFLRLARSPSSILCAGTVTVRPKALLKGGEIRINCFLTLTHFNLKMD